MAKQGRRRSKLPDTPEVWAAILDELKADTIKFRATRDALAIAEAALTQADERLKQAMADLYQEATGA